MNSTLLKTFITIVESGNISLAASRLYTSQSTVSYRLKQLEDELGVQLIHRYKGFTEIQLTSYGEYFLGLAKNYLQLIDKMYSLKDKAEHQTINIDGLQSINNVLFKPLYERLVEKRPGLFLYIYTDHASRVIDRVSNFVADIGFVCSLTRSTNVKFYELFQEELLLLCRKDSGYYEGIHPMELDVRYELYSLWTAQYENWHRQMFGPARNSIAVLRTGGAMLLDMFFRPEVWYISTASLAASIQKSSKYDLVTYRMSPPPPMVPCYKILPTVHQHHSEGLAIFEEELEQFIAELKQSEYYH